MRKFIAVVTLTASLATAAPASAWGSWSAKDTSPRPVCVVKRHGHVHPCRKLRLRTDRFGSWS